MAKTPFNEESEPFFSMAGIRRLDFYDDRDAGQIVAFNLNDVRQGKPVTEENSVLVCKSADILPEALELILAAPLLWRTLAASYHMQQTIIDIGERMQSYLHSRGVSDGTLNTLIKVAHDCQNMSLAAMNIPVKGRDESLKGLNAPIDISRTKGRIDGA